MDEMWKEALERSIAKWNDIVYNDGVDNFGDNCALCQLEDELREDEDDDSCARCPVAIATGEEQCDGSPWEEWNLHQQRSHRGAWPYRTQCDECERLAEKELEFLKSLRDK